MCLLFSPSLNSQIFWFGDLNYRLNMMDTEVRELVAQERWDKLINSDQVDLHTTLTKLFTFPFCTY